MSYDPANIFARILRGEVPCDKILETEHSFAFHDISPKAPAHALIIPKGPYIHFEDFAARATPEEQLDYIRAIHATAEKLGVRQSGFRLITNSGADARQEVPHLHVHLVGGCALGPKIVEAEGKTA